MAKKKVKETGMINWDEKLAADAEVAAGMESSSGGGQFFSLKAGVLSFNDAPLPGNEMGVIILDSVLENVYYEGEYDAANPKGPDCFAFGRDESKMVPHEVVVKTGTAVHVSCQGCPNNEWGTAAKGKGKACKNTRRLGMIPAGDFDDQGRFNGFDEVEHFETASVAFMKLPITSVKGYAGFVNQIAGTLKRPPHGVFTKVSVVPDPKSVFKVVFTPIAKVPDDLMEAVMKRHEEVKATIEFPYQPNEDAEESKPKKAATRKPNGRPVAKAGKKKRKY